MTYLEALNEYGSVGWADIKPPRNYSKMKPVVVLNAQRKATEAWRKYDELVDKAIASGDVDEFHNSFQDAIEEAAEEARQAEKYADSLFSSYLSDPNPASWFEVQNA